MIVLNKSRGMFVLNLKKGHDYENEELAPTPFRMAVPVALEDGGTGHQIIERELPASISWLPGETKSQVPDAVTEIEEFQRAVAAGTLEVVPAQDLALCHLSLGNERP